MVPESTAYRFQCGYQFFTCSSMLAESPAYKYMCVFISGSIKLHVKKLLLSLIEERYFDIINP